VTGTGPGGCDVWLPVRHGRDAREPQRIAGHRCGAAPSRQIWNYLPQPAGGACLPGWICQYSHRSWQWPSGSKRGRRQPGSVISPRSGSIIVVHHSTATRSSVMMGRPLRTATSRWVPAPRCQYWRMASLPRNGSRKTLDRYEASGVNKPTTSSASAVSQPAGSAQSIGGSHRSHLQDAVTAGVPVAPRQRFLRFHSAWSALLTQPFLLSLPLLLIFLLLILTLGSCILILLCSPSHQCTSERARSVKIIWR
jgi:hypothetical protein